MENKTGNSVWREPKKKGEAICILLICLRMGDHHHAFFSFHVSCLFLSSYSMALLTASQRFSLLLLFLLRRKSIKTNRQMKSERSPMCCSSNPLLCWWTRWVLMLCPHPGPPSSHVGVCVCVCVDWPVNALRVISWGG